MIFKILHAYVPKALVTLCPVFYYFEHGQGIKPLFRYGLQIRFGYKRRINGLYETIFA